ncbi:MAG: hypothetical protein ACK4EY_16140 [Flavipsychrobacter sp.]
MARTREDWIALYTAPAAAAGLVISAVAEWLGLRDLTIAIAMRLETIIELLKADIDYALANKQAGSFYWYPIAVKEFQYGDSLTVEDGIVKYATIDATKQIVKVVSAQKLTSGTIAFKVAKDDGTGNLVQLTTPELAALDDYIGSRVADAHMVVSIPADVVKYTIEGRYNPLYNKTDVQNGILAALQANKLNFGFDTKFYKAQVFEDVMGVAGMVSLKLRIDMTLNSGTQIVSDLTEYTDLPAGYFNWDAASTITLTPAV